MAGPAPQTIAFALGGPVGRADLPRLCERASVLLERCRADVILCDVSGVEPDAVTVEVLARFQLAARRQGSQVRLRNASRELLELVTFMGLRDVLPE